MITLDCAACWKAFSVIGLESFLILFAPPKLLILRFASLLMVWFLKITVKGLTVILDIFIANFHRKSEPFQITITVRSRPGTMK